jgi:hypothetical protein
MYGRKDGIIDIWYGLLVNGSGTEWINVAGRTLWPCLFLSNLNHGLITLPKRDTFLQQQTAFDASDSRFDEELLSSVSRIV